MSFELKPETSTIGMGVHIDDVAWTHPRSPVPPLLVGRVSESTWASTFDAVRSRWETDLQAAGSMSCIMFIPCAICCTMSKMIEAQRQSHEGWLNLVRSEQEKYRPYGISVSLAKEISTMGVGSSRRISNETVGLKFDVGPMPGGAAYVTADPLVATQTMIRNDNGDVVSKLDKLAQLHRTGALSDEEYSKAKAKLLNE